MDKGTTSVSADLVTQAASMIESAARDGWPMPMAVEFDSVKSVMRLIDMTDGDKHCIGWEPY